MSLNVNKHVYLSSSTTGLESLSEDEMIIFNLIWLHYASDITSIISECHDQSCYDTSEV